MAFGSTLSDAQASLDRQQAAQAANLYNSLAQAGQFRQAGLERERLRQEAEAERAARFFQAGLERDLANRQLAQKADLFNRQLQANEAAAKLANQRAKDAAELANVRAIDLANIKTADLEKTLSSQKDIEEIRSKRLDPKILEARQTSQLLEAELSDDIDFLTKASTQRKAAIEELRNIQGRRGFFGSLSDEDESMKEQLEAIIDGIDSEALRRGSSPTVDGGLIIPSESTFQTQSFFPSSIPSRTQVPLATSNSPLNQLIGPAAGTNRLPQSVSSPVPSGIPVGTEPRLKPLEDSYRKNQGGQAIANIKGVRHQFNGRFWIPIQ